jgi:hypothetical protein
MRIPLLAAERPAGVDSVQAVLLAFQRIGIELYTSVYHEAGD